MSKTILSFEFDIDNWVKGLGYSYLFDLRESVNKEIDIRKRVD